MSALMDTLKLAKLLNLTESDNDHEALSSIRRANELLRAAKLSWHHVLGVKSGLREMPRSRFKRDQYFEDIFDTLEQKANQLHAMDLLSTLQRVRREIFV